MTAGWRVQDVEFLESGFSLGQRGLGLTTEAQLSSCSGDRKLYVCLHLAVAMARSAAVRRMACLRAGLLRGLGLVHTRDGQW